jgi:4-hydroxymandelate synthase
VTAQHITRLELYTADRDRAVEYLTHLGLAPTGAFTGASLPDRTTTVLSSGTATIAVSAPVGSDGPVAAHLERHGDGIAEIVIACADPEASRRSALAAGATADDAADAAGTGRIGIRVPGLEPVRHVLVAADADPEHPEVAPTQPSLFDHLALCVRTGTVGQVAEFYQQGLGLDLHFSEFTEVGRQAMSSLVVQSASGGVTFVIVESAVGHEPGQLDTFLAANDGPGVHHIALLVGDLVGYVPQAGERGIEFLDAPDAYYDVIHDRDPDIDPDVAADLAAVRGTGILVDTDEWGELLQVFTRSPYPRGTLFYELVERRKARTFGTRNIRALYEAVEQSRSRVG